MDEVEQVGIRPLWFIEPVRRAISLKVEPPTLADRLEERLERIQPARLRTEVAEPIFGAMDLVAPGEG